MRVVIGSSLESMLYRGRLYSDETSTRLKNLTHAVREFDHLIHHVRRDGLPQYYLLGVPDHRPPLCKLLNAEDSEPIIPGHLKRMFAESPYYLELALDAKYYYDRNNEHKNAAGYRNILAVRAAPDDCGTSDNIFLRMVVLTPAEGAEGKAYLEIGANVASRLRCGYVYLDKSVERLDDFSKHLKAMGEVNVCRAWNILGFFQSCASRMRNAPKGIRTSYLLK